MHNLSRRNRLAYALLHSRRCGSVCHPGADCARDRWQAAFAYPLAAKIFVPLWLVVAAANAYIGVARAGYSIGEELPIFLAVFAIPAAVALAAAHWLR
ncbi:MAG TPA: hypothetical protein VNG69_01260 [Casimicrobiaceae bacterium]|nr:hypothetical protein [Casimicrobiaceae bacterium]